MPHIPKVICGGCNVEMRRLKNGTKVEMLLEDGNPYYKINGDAFTCPRCSRTVITQFADRPFANNFDADYDKQAVDIQADFL